MTDVPQAKPRILITDDAKVVRLVFCRNLGAHFDILEAEDGVDALEVLGRESGIKVLFTDLGMPNMDGYELISKVRGSDRPEIAKLPIIVVTGADESEGVKEKVMALGATDLIRKPFDAAEVKSRAMAYTDYNNKVAALEKTQARDILTGLTARDYFEQQGEKTVAFARRHCHEVTVVRLCIDRYSQLIADLGKGVMDKVLVLVADIFKKTLRQEDDASWFGGEQFALSLPGTNPDEASHALQRVREKTANINLRIGEKVVRIGFSIGIASQVIDADGYEFADLMGRAEWAMQKAVAAGGGKTMRAPSEAPLAPAIGAEMPEVSIDGILDLLAEEGAQISHPQLAAAMRKFLPLMARADQQLKLGLVKVIQHLDNRLPK